MAVQISDGSGTPHATDYADLLSKLKTFATAHGWTSLEDTSDKLVLQGDGGASDQIIVAFQKYADVPNDAYGWFINGYTGYTGGLTFLQQPGALPNLNSSQPAYPAMALWNSTIPYWFVVSGRRIIVVAKVSTTFQMCYAGFYLPYASPGQYPYPQMIGGCQSRLSTTANPRWSDISTSAQAFWRARTASPGTLFNRLPDGSWKAIFNQQSFNLVDFTGNLEQGIFPYNQTSKIGIDHFTSAIDGSPVLTPLQWMNGARNLSQVGWYGELDGLFHISGSGRASEDVVTVSSVDYLVVQDIFRTGVSDYVAVKLA